MLGNAVRTLRIGSRTAARDAWPRKTSRGMMLADGGWDGCLALIAADGEDGWAGTSDGFTSALQTFGGFSGSVWVLLIVWYLT